MPNTMTPNTIDISNASIATATTVAEPRSPARFASGHRLCRDAEAHPRRRVGADTCNHEGSVTPELQLGVLGANPARRLRSGALVASGRQSRCFPRGVDATQLDRDR
jgi:hypothetical protein